MESATTPPLDAAPVDKAPPIKHSSTSRQIRGSSLMLLGRSMSMAVNAIVQIFIIQYLSKPEYGAFAYALSIVNLAQMVASLGLDRSISRFVPIYHEQRDYDKMFGAILLGLGTILSLGLAMILLVYGLQGFIAQTLIDDRLAIALLLVLIVLAPVQALDELLISLFAIFAGPRSIFFRKYVLAPGLKLLTVVLLILLHSGVMFLTVGYLVSGALGVAIYSVILFRVLKKQGLFQHFSRHAIHMPAAEIFAFTIPLLTTDLLYVVMNSIDAVLLGYYGGALEVAALRSVQTGAGLNQLAMMSFQTLFTPLAARLFARKNYEGINDLYWQTAIWMAVISFPIFAVTFALAQPLTILLYTERYASSAPILALLSLGYYFSTILGFNGLTIRVFGNMRYLVAINVIALLVNIGINLLLIPRFGALGAGIGTCSTMIVHNLLKQLGLRSCDGMKVFDWRYLKLYIVIAVSSLSLLFIQSLVSAYMYIGIMLVALLSLCVVVMNRKSLNVHEMFPELLRFPLVRKIFG